METGNYKYKLFCTFRAKRYIFLIYHQIVAVEKKDIILTATRRPSSAGNLRTFCSRFCKRDKSVTTCFCSKANGNDVSI